MPTTVDLSGLGRLQARLARIANPDPALLLLSWEREIDADNRRGVLAGLDKDGNPLPPVKYRPAPYGKLGRVYKRRREYNPGIGGNLSSREYRQLDGPPLAPRGAGSRVITNLKTRNGPLGPNQWEAVGFWDDVVSRKGVPFLSSHFDGAHVGRGHGFKLPVRDLRGIRPEGKQKCRDATRAWAISTIRSNPTGAA